MKIRSYLAILVVISLIGGNGVQYFLSEKFDHVSAQSQNHVDVLLWQKDFQRTSSDIRQYFISADIVIGAGETYLASGTIDKGKLIAQNLEALATTNQLLNVGRVSELTAAASGVNTINGYLREIAISGVSESDKEVAALLERYDKIASDISICITTIEADLLGAINKNANRLKVSEDDMRFDSLKIQLLFSMLVIFSWYWASRTICKPLQKLRNDANEADSGVRFVGVDSGPEEIKQLSDNFSKLTQSLSFQATHDPLTKLYNRRAFGRALKEYLQQAQEDELSHALCFIDLDHFKAINDTCGHAAGDEMLTHVAKILIDGVRTSDVVARLGGDEFAILLHGCSIKKAEVIANTIRNTIRDFEYRYDDHIFRIGASIGITEISAKGGEVEDILNTADIACMQAKVSGRDVVITFDTCMDLLDQKRSDAIGVNQIKDALKENRFVLYRQKIVALQGSENGGDHYEMLLRMYGQDGEVISPAVFIPIVENYRLGTEIDRWVINEALDWLSDNSQELEQTSMCSINLSGQSVGSPDMKNFIVDKINEKGFPAHKLCFEITETAAINDLECANELIASLKACGCRFALDDFGSGLSSFAYLKNLQVDYVKIDGAFVKDMLTVTSDRATVKAINDVAKANGKATIAEFVETEDIAHDLMALGIDFAQGYHFDKPSPLVKKIKTKIEAEVASSPLLEGYAKS